MPITLPKSPDVETMKMLIKANSFLNHSKQHAYLGSDFDVMIAIHDLDNAIEYMLRILIRHLDIEEITGKTINTCELAQLIGEIQRFLKDNTNQSLPYIQEMKMIRELRNIVQHAMVLPIQELQTYLVYGTKFFEKCLLKSFGITINDIRYSTLIKSDIVQQELRRAEEYIDAGKYLESIVESRNAFEYSNFIYNNDSWHRIERAPAFSELKSSNANLYYYLKAIDDRLSIDISNVDVKKYLRYKEYMDYIPKEYQADWHSNREMQRPWNKEDAEFCYSFVANALLQWESNNYKPINDRMEDEEQPFPAKFVRRLFGVEVESIFPEYGCTYALDTDCAILFYTDKDGAQKLKSGLTNGIGTSEFVRYTFDKLDAHTTELIKVINYDINLIMNKPATWEVIVNFRFVPFTKKSLIGEEAINIDIAGEESFANADINEDVAKIILKFMKENSSLDTCSKAFELEKAIEKYPETSIYQFISPKLIESLSPEN